MGWSKGRKKNLKLYRLDELSMLSPLRILAEYNPAWLPGTGHIVKSPQGILKGCPPPARRGRGEGLFEPLKVKAGGVA